MKKKNNKGFFLAETIVVVALITIVMAFVYPNVAKLYDNYSKKANYYDQIQDLYTLRAIESSFSGSDYNQLCAARNPLMSSNGKIVEVKRDEANNPLIGGLKRVYLTKYKENVKIEDTTDPKYLGSYDFNRYLNRLRVTTSDNKAYRLIGIFEEEIPDENNPLTTKIETRYASIKIYIEGCK